MSIRRKSCIALLLLLTVTTSNPLKADIRIGLLSLDRPLSLTVNICEGKYKMLIAGQHYNINTNDNILIARAGNKVLITTASGNTILSDSLLLKSVNPEAYFSIRNNFKGTDPREYYGDLVISSDIESLIVINTIDAERYLAGVVQAEAGLKGNIEYFKTQAMLARTYLYMNINRHMLDGYNLCDNIHCQAYNGRSEVQLIYEAVNATRGQVLVNADSLLVFTPFHSNCGGQTQSSENVWLTSNQHLSGVIDPYCSQSRNARWVREIEIEKWISYLDEHGYRHLNNNELLFKQLSRKRDYIAGSFSYPLVNIRQDWGLKSTFFSTRLVGNTIILEGRGYGHGVGLCQEGARVMSERGFKMDEIINFYFQGLRIIEVDDVKPSVEISSAF